jgi:hypothetical protein
MGYIIIGTVVYLIGFSVVWRGFRHTFFQQTLPAKILMSAGWPFLLLSGGYRRNFQRALKGRD